MAYGVCQERSQTSAGSRLLSHLLCLKFRLSDSSAQEICASLLELGSPARMSEQDPTNEELSLAPCLDKIIAHPCEQPRIAEGSRQETRLPLDRRSDSILVDAHVAARMHPRKLWIVMRTAHRKRRRTSQIRSKKTVSFIMKMLQGTRTEQCRVMSWEMSLTCGPTMCRVVSPYVDE